MGEGRGACLRVVALAAVLLSPLPATRARADTRPAILQAEFTPSISSIVLDPVASATLYAGTDAGIFKSVDSAESWQRASDGLPNLAVFAVAIDPLAPATLYAGTPVGVFRSNDGAASWTSASTGLPDSRVWALAVDPQNSSRIFAATDAGLFRTSDAAESWSRAGHFARASEIVMDLRDPRILYAVADISGFFGSVIFRSEDGGDTWAQATAGLPSGPRGPLGSGALTIDPTTPSTLYASSSIGIYKSIDGARSWFPINSGLPCSQVPPPICPGASSLAVDPVFPERLYAGTALGLFRSPGRGVFWSLSNEGLGVRRVLRLTVDRASPNTVFAGTDRGVFVSKDGGGHWTEASHGLAAPARLRLLFGRFSVQLLAFDPRTGRSATGDPLPVNDIFGYFTLTGLTANAGNPEVFVKVLDGRVIDGHFWVFYGGLTDLEYTLTVTDTLTGRTRTYSKVFGSACGGFDTAAFPG